MLEKVADLNSLTVALGLGIIALLVWYLAIRKKYNLPPGPNPWPIVGNGPEFYAQMNQNEWMAAMTKKYGPVFTFYLGSQPQIVLGKIDIINEVLVKNIDQFIHRVSPLHMRDLTEGGSDIFNSNYCPRLKFQRKISRTAMRNIMLNNNAIGHVTNAILKRAYREMDYYAETGNEYCPRDMVFCTTYAIFAELCLSKSFDLHDPDLKFLSYAFNTVQGIVDDKFVYWRDTLEFIFKHLPKFGGIKRALYVVDEFVNYCARHTEGHRQTAKAAFKAREKKDVVDSILEALDDRKGEENNIVFEEKFLRQTVVEIFSGGADSNMVVIYPMLLQLANNPEAQETMFQEINTVIGPYGEILSEDRNRLPYCHAVLLEGMRLRPAAPLTIHACQVDSKLNGYDIPKNTPIYINIQGIQTDPEEWDEPLQFKPERWIDENGHIIKHKSYLPFSAGRRVCIGEVVAKAHIFVHVASLIQRYKFKQPVPGKKIDMEGAGGLFVADSPYFVILEKRRKELTENSK